MSNVKITNSPASNDPVVVGKGGIVAAKKPLKDVDVTSLEIDDNDDFGGDPYNHTGSHAVPDFGQDD